MSLTPEKLKTLFHTEMHLDDTVDISEDTLLFSTGLLDSLQLIRLVTFIEAEEELKVKPMEVTLHHLDSIEKILAYAEKKKNPDG